VDWIEAFQNYVRLLAHPSITHRKRPENCATVVDYPRAVRHRAQVGAACAIGAHLRRPYSPCAYKPFLMTEVSRLIAPYPSWRRLESQESGEFLRTSIHAAMTSLPSMTATRFPSPSRRPPSDGRARAGPRVTRSKLKYLRG
jgi:hypothetical protein